MSGTYAELSGEELSQFQTFYRVRLASTLGKRTDAIEEAEELEFARDMLLAALNEGLTPGAAGEESYLKPDATDWTDPATLRATQAATGGKLPRLGGGRLAVKELWQAAGALLAVLAILYWQFGPSIWSAANEVTPEATSEAGGRTTPTPLPTLESELLANIVDAAGVKTGLVAPRTLEIKGVSFVVQPVKITAGDWPPPDDERAASWVYGTVINYVMGLEATPANKQLIASLRAGDELLLRMSTGPAFHFAFIDAVRIAPQASELFRQARPGLTLALLEDGEQPDRAMVRAAYLPESEVAGADAARTIAVGQAANLDSLRLTCTGSEAQSPPGTPPGQLYLTVYYRLENTGLLPLLTGTFSHRLTAGGLTLPQAPVRDEVWPATIQPGQVLSGTAAYLVPETAAGQSLTWSFAANPSGPAVQVALPPDQGRLSAEVRLKEAVFRDGVLLVTFSLTAPSVRGLDLSAADLTLKGATIHPVGNYFPWQTPSGGSQEFTLLLAPSASPVRVELLNQGFELTY